MDLQTFWFCLIASSGRATSCSRGSTSASGCCCRSSRATTRSASTLLADDRPGLGRQRGLARRRRAARPSPRSRPGTRRCSRASTWRCCSSSSSSSSASSRSSGAAKSESPRWRAVWTWANTIGSLGAPLVWGVGLPCARARHARSTRTGDYAGSSWTCSAPTRVFAGVAVVLAVRLPRRDLPHAAHGRRAARPRRARGPAPCDPGASSSAPSSSPGRWPSRSTETTRISSRPCSRPPSRSWRSRSPSLFTLRGRSGRAFAMTGSGSSQRS